MAARFQNNAPASALSRRAFVCLSAAGAASVLGALSGCGGEGETDAASDAADGESASGGAAETDADNPLGLVTPGSLTVGSDCDYPPFISMDGEQPQGYEYDLMTEICDRMGLELVYLAPQKFDTLVPSVYAGGKMDVAVSSVTITEDRLDDVDFTEPYCDSNQSITVLKDSGYTSRDDLAGKTVAVHSGTTGQDWATENLPDSTIVPYDDQSSAFAALAAGKADAFCEDLPIAQYMVANAYPDCEIIEEIPTGEQYAIAVSKENPALLEALNEQLAALDEEDFLDELYARYFEESAE